MTNIPVEFNRIRDGGVRQLAGNFVKLEGANHQPINQANPLPVDVTSVQNDVSVNNVAEPGANLAATLTFAAVAGEHHVISGVAWSYDDDPTGGNLLIEDGAGVTVFSIDITTSGPGFIPFDPPKHGSINTALIITLAAGGAGISGKVNVLGHWRE